MASRQRRAILIHNEKAGDKRHEREALVDLLERAGYSVSYFPAKHCDLGEVLGHPAEIIVSAGGDGTVARVVREARSDGPPIAVLPIAPEAYPSDRDLDICFVGDNDTEREGFARWLDDPDSAKGVPVSVRRGQRLTVAGQFRRIRLDSKLWEGEPDPRAANSWPVIGIATEPQPLHFLVPG